LDRRPRELRGRPPRKARCDADPFVDERHAGQPPRTARAAERGPARQREIAALGVAGRERQVPLDREASVDASALDRAKAIARPEGRARDGHELLDADGARRRARAREGDCDAALDRAPGAVEPLTEE